MAVIVLLVALPWFAAIVLVASRLGWSALTSDEGKAFPSQASGLRAFGRGAAAG